MIPEFPDQDHGILRASRKLRNHLWQLPNEVETEFVLLFKNYTRPRNLTRIQGLVELFALWLTLESIHTYIHTYMHTYIHTYIHTCMHAYINTCMHACMHACMHTYIHTYIRTYIYIYIYTYIHACMHTCMHACIHTYIHAYIHTYIHWHCASASPTPAWLRGNFKTAPSQG